MEFTYGEGNFSQGSSEYKGQIILSEHKLYIKGPSGEYPQTYVPLEKIVRIKKWSNSAVISVDVSMATKYMVS